MFNRQRYWLGVLICVTALLLMASSASAAKKKRKSSRGQNRVTVDSFESGSGTDLGIAEIEGRIFKPAVFFVLARTDFRYSGLKFKQSFVDRIVKGALRRPF
ncbi:MAG TPA: hypothetical protein DCQ06_08975 [Myxococcales bacterium]|nr:hypothetical protein [Myxococcales bacterium]